MDAQNANSKNRLILLLSFMLIFAGYASTERYLAALFHAANKASLSLIALSLIYISMALAAFIAPAVCRKLGVRCALFLAALNYPLFILSVISQQAAFMYATAVLLGIGAAVLWTAQGIMVITLTTQKNRGTYTGIFFGAITAASALLLFVMSQFVEGAPLSLIFAIFFLSALGGSFLLLQLPKDAITTRSRNAAPGSGLLQLLGNRQMLLFLPFVFAAYFMHGLMSGTIALRMTELFGLRFVGILTGIFTLFLVLVPGGVGWLADRAGLRGVVFLSPLSLIAGFVLLLFSHRLIPFSIGVALLAFGQATFLGVSYPCIARFFRKEIAAAVALRWLVASLAIATGILASLVAGFSTLLIAGIAIGIASFLSITVLMLKKTKQKPLKAFGF